jgi:hypothetical protein
MDAGLTGRAARRRWSVVGVFCLRRGLKKQTGTKKQPGGARKETKTKPTRLSAQAALGVRGRRPGKGRVHRGRGPGHVGPGGQGQDVGEDAGRGRRRRRSAHCCCEKEGRASNKKRFGGVDSVALFSRHRPSAFRCLRGNATPQHRRCSITMADGGGEYAAHPWHDGDPGEEFPESAFFCFLAPTTARVPPLWARAPRGQAPAPLNLPRIVRGGCVTSVRAGV